MLKSLLLLASSITQQDIVDESKRQSFRLDPTDTMLVLGAVVMVIGLVFFWALYVRKRPDNKHGSPRLLDSGHVHSSHDSGRHGTRRRVRKRRRRHGDHYPRNPTLGETGGLPPPREEPPEPEPEAEGQPSPESPRSSK